MPCSLSFWSIRESARTRLPYNQRDERAHRAGSPMRAASQTCPIASSQRAAAMALRAASYLMSAVTGKVCAHAPSGQFAIFFSNHNSAHIVARLKALCLGDRIFHSELYQIFALGSGGPSVCPEAPGVVTGGIGGIGGIEVIYGTVVVVRIEANLKFFDGG